MVLRKNEKKFNGFKDADGKLLLKDAFYMYVPADIQASYGTSPENTPEESLPRISCFMGQYQQQTYKPGELDPIAAVFYEADFNEDGNCRINQRSKYEGEVKTYKKVKEIAEHSSEVANDVVKYAYYLRKNAECLEKLLNMDSEKIANVMQESFRRQFQNAMRGMP